MNKSESIIAQGRGASSRENLNRLPQEALPKEAFFFSRDIMTNQNMELSPDQLKERMRNISKTIVHEHKLTPHKGILAKLKTIIISAVAQERILKSNFKNSTKKELARQMLNELKNAYERLLDGGVKKLISFDDLILTMQNKNLVDSLLNSHSTKTSLIMALLESWEKAEIEEAGLELDPQLAQKTVNKIHQGLASIAKSNPAAELETLNSGVQPTNQNSVVPITSENAQQALNTLQNCINIGRDPRGIWNLAGAKISDMAKKVQIAKHLYFTVKEDKVAELSKNVFILHNYYQGLTDKQKSGEEKPPALNINPVVLSRVIDFLTQKRRDGLRHAILPQPQGIGTGELASAAHSLQSLAQLYQGQQLDFKADHKMSYLDKASLGLKLITAARQGNKPIDHPGLIAFCRELVAAKRKAKGGKLAVDQQTKFEEKYMTNFESLHKQVPLNELAQLFKKRKKTTFLARTWNRIFDSSDYSLNIATARVTLKKLLQDQTSRTVITVGKPSEELGYLITLPKLAPKLALKYQQTINVLTEDAFNQKIPNLDLAAAKGKFKLVLEHLTNDCLTKNGEIKLGKRAEVIAGSAYLDQIFKLQPVAVNQYLEEKYNPDMPKNLRFICQYLNSKEGCDGSFSAINTLKKIITTMDRCNSNYKKEAERISSQPDAALLPRQSDEFSDNLSPLGIFHDKQPELDSGLFNPATYNGSFLNEANPEEEERKDNNNNNNIPKKPAHSGYQQQIKLE